MNDLVRGMCTILVLSMVTAGCGGEAAVEEGLMANDPGMVGVPPRRPPVPPEALEIVPTGMSPVSTSAVRPDPILPKMDEVYKTRVLPGHVEPSPATQPSGHEGPPEGQYQPEHHQGGPQP